MIRSFIYIITGILTYSSASGMTCKDALSISRHKLTISISESQNLVDRTIDIQFSELQQAKLSIEDAKSQLHRILTEIFFSVYFQPNLKPTPADLVNDQMSPLGYRQGWINTSKGEIFPNEGYLGVYNNVFLGYQRPPSDFIYYTLEVIFGRAFAGQDLQPLRSIKWELQGLSGVLKLNPYNYSLPSENLDAIKSISWNLMSHIAREIIDLSQVQNSHIHTHLLAAMTLAGVLAGKNTSNGLVFERLFWLVSPYMHDHLGIREMSSSSTLTLSLSEPFSALESILPLARERLELNF